MHAHVHSSSLTQDTSITRKSFHPINGQLNYSLIIIQLIGFSSPHPVRLDLIDRHLEYKVFNGFFLLYVETNQLSDRSYFNRRNFERFTYFINPN